MVPPGWAAWFVRREAGGGLLRQIGTHDLDRVRYLTGEEFTRLSAQLTPWSGSLLPWSDQPAATGDGGYAVLASLTGGGQARLVSSRQHRDYKEAVLSGESGTLIFTEAVFGPTQTAALLSSPSAPPVALALPGDQEGAFLAGLLADFIAAIRRGGVAHRSVPSLPTIADGLRAQEAVAAIEQASRERREVLLPDARRAG
jgi:predicted dehydrogenase